MNDALQIRRARIAATAGETGPPSRRRSEGWSRQRWLMLIALVFAAQVAVHFCPRRKTIPAAARRGECPATDAGGQFQRTARARRPDALCPAARERFRARRLAGNRRRVECRRFAGRNRRASCRSPAAKISARCSAGSCRQTRLPDFQPDFKPPPKLSEPVLPLPPMFAENSTLRINGELAQRKLLTPAKLPSGPMRT